MPTANFNRYYVLWVCIKPVLELSDRENFIITTVERVVFTIMNTIMIVGILNIPIYIITKFKHGFLTLFELSQLWAGL